MDRTDWFVLEVKKLLLRKIKEKKVDLTALQINLTHIMCDTSPGKGQYMIDTTLLDKIPDDILIEINELWKSSEKVITFSLI